MIEAVVPYCWVNETERKESVGMAAEAAMLCINPNVCPISWAMIYSKVSDTMSSGMRATRARGSICEVWTKRQSSIVFTTSLYTSTVALMISPVRGSVQEGPIAFSTSVGRYLIHEYLKLSGSKFGSLVGKSCTWITFLKPIFSKALFQRRTPFLMAFSTMWGTYSRYNKQLALWVR